MNHWLAELRRRNVLRVAAAYLVFSWLALQVIGVVSPILALPEWLPRTILVLLAFGFVAALALSWIYELTPEGVRRTEDVAHHDSITTETGRRLDRLTIAGLAVAIAVVAADRFWPRTPVPASEMGTEGIKANPEAGSALIPSVPISKSIAVLPFVPLSDGKDDAYFADGLTEEILNSLSQLPELLVTARTSAFHFKGKDLPIPEVAKTLGVAHVLEGSVRRAGGRLRVTAQLIRALDGFHLWSETYDRGEADVFAVQDDIAGRVADALDVLLDEGDRQRLQETGVRDIEAYIAFQRGMVLYNEAHRVLNQRITLLTQANREFDAAIARAPGFFAAYVARSDLYGHVLQDPAFGQTTEAITPELQAGAEANLRESLDLAYAHARNAAERDSVDVTRIYLSRSWVGLGDALGRLVDRRQCVQHLYGDRAALFGMAGRGLPFYERQVACDPYDIGTQFPLAQALIWSRDFERADQVAASGLELLGEAPFLANLKFMALIGRRDFAGARALAGSPALPPAARAGFEAMVLAAEGRREEAQAAAKTWRDAGQPSPLIELPIEAWLGERERANAVAARIDTNSASPAGVMTMVRLCVCGAPFDLEATPNFARQIAESGLAWPPPIVLELPLKTW